MWTRLVPLKPFVEFRTVLVAKTEHYELWDVLVTARGGGAVDEITAKPSNGPVRLIGPGTQRNLRSGQTHPFHVQIDDVGARGSVRINTSGEVETTADVPVGGQP